MYKVGKNNEDKEVADRVLLNNSLRLIADSDVSPEEKLRAAHCAYAYYLAVYKFGGPAFWGGKNKPEELGFIEPGQF